MILLTCAPTHNNILFFEKVLTEIKEVFTVVSIPNKNFLQMDLPLPINILTIKIKKKIY